jgi:hypothetical protein
MAIPLWLSTAWRTAPAVAITTALTLAGIAYIAALLLFRVVEASDILALIHPKRMKA